MNKLVLKSYAKLNLYLEVLNIRKDNYHNIETVFERIDLKDTIILKARPDRLIKIICGNHSVPGDSSNLCYRSAALLQRTFKIKHGLDIKIIKRIPVGSGLGGGSSNAATVFLGLNRAWRLGLSRAKLTDLAKKIGSDVPFFLYDSPFAEGTNRGDRIRPLPALKRVRLWHILVMPEIKVSTPLIYRRWDKGRTFKLTKRRRNAKILLSAILKKDLCLISQLLFNSLEEVTISLYPEVCRIKEALATLGLKSILMSGSGPAVFGIVASRKEAVSISRQLKAKHRSWQVYVTRTL